MRTFWLCFVPLFVAVDAIGVLPLYFGLTEGISVERQRGIILRSILTALVVALLFLFVGEVLLRLLGITVSDFMIAGGAVLFLISLSDLMSSDKRLRQVGPDDLGPVPIGVPLIVGPAVLTTIMLLVRTYGFIPTMLATVANILIAGLAFVFSGFLMGALGKSGAKIVSKIANLLLAAIGVMMVRRGVMALVGIDG